MKNLADDICKKCPDFEECKKAYREDRHFECCNL